MKLFPFRPRSSGHRQALDRMDLRIRSRDLAKLQIGRPPRRSNLEEGKSTQMTWLGESPMNCLRCLLITTIHLRGPVPPLFHRAFSGLHGGVLGARSTGPTHRGPGDVGPKYQAGFFLYPGHEGVGLGSQIWVSNPYFDGPRAVNGAYGQQPWVGLYSL